MIVTLTSDFGLKDPYVAAMKGVILSRVRSARMVDITHDIPPHDVRTGCITLDAVRRYFPPRTIHLAVVDPGVGTDRCGIVVAADGQFFVGPDNGLFSFAAEIKGAKFWKIDGDRKKGASTTFHGRDIFAPVAAQLLKGKKPSTLGSAQKTIHTLALPKAFYDDHGARGEIIAIDRFGDLITNIERRECKIQGMVFIGEKSVGAIQKTYASVPEGALVALWESWDRLEIAVRNGSAAAQLHANIGDPVTLRGEK